MAGSADATLRSEEELDERIGQCLERVERMEKRLEDRILQGLKDLAGCLEAQFLRRFKAIEVELQQKVSAELCRKLVEETLRPIDGWLEDLAQAACRRPCLLAGRSPERPSPERTVPERKEARRPAQASSLNGQREEESYNEGQRPNLPISLVVEFCPSEGPSAGVRSEVSVEVRANDKVSDVKQRALNQLDMWGRFNRIGQLAEGEASSDEDLETAASALPGHEACRLYALEEASKKLLEESASIGESGLQHGMRLLLATLAAAKAAEAEAAKAEAAVRAAPLMSAPSVRAAQQAEEEDGPAPAVHSGGQSGPMNVVVRHEEGEVTVEARTSHTIEFLKSRAHEQLTVWYRFCALGGADGGDAEALPPLEECQLWKSGPDGAPVLLQERSPLAECGIESGQHLVLRAVG